LTQPIYSPGLEGIIAGPTGLCLVEQTGLWYRGYGIEELAGHARFEEVVHLLYYGELPTRPQLDRLRADLDRYRELPGPIVDTLKLIPKDVPMMDVLRTAISMAGHFSPVKGESIDDWRQEAIRLLSVAAAILGARYRLIKGKDPVPPREGLSHAGQILWLFEGRQPDPLAEQLINLTLILYAEHEYNASTYTARVIASTLSDMTSAVVGAIGALKGPLHGGANEQSMQLMRRFGSAEEAEQWTLRAIRNKEKVVGFGHRVYKQGDHRAWILEEKMKQLAHQKGETRLVAVYDAIKNTMRREKNIFCNVDFPCGLVYYLLGLPLDVYTPLFVCSRVSGWCAHIMEQHFDNRIIRPLSEYTGPPKRPWVPLEKR